MQLPLRTYWLPQPARAVARMVRALVIGVQTRLAAVHPSPIFLLGNQKSGTSAIAALLARMTGLPLSLDIRRDIPVPIYPKVKNGEIAFAEYVRLNKLDFSRDLIKEPNLTLLHAELAQHFPESKFIFVVRDPRDNIRSILNRLNVPGDLPDLEPLHTARFTPAWRFIMDASWLGLPRGTYIEMLANRWNLMADVYLANRETMILIQYETFLQDKVQEIRRLAHTLGLEPIRDISDKLDVDFQPRGSRDVDLHAFFGEDNLRRVEGTCGERMRAFGYSVRRARREAVQDPVGL